MKNLRTLVFEAGLRRFSWVAVYALLQTVAWATEPAPLLLDSGIPAPAENFKALFDAQRAKLSEPTRLYNDFGVEAHWFPAPPNDWLASNVLGYGFNVEGYPTIAKSSASAFALPQPPLTSASGVGQTRTQVFYLKNEDEARKFVQSSEGIDLGFSIGAFSLGLDFQSSHMSQSTSSSIKAWYVVTYSDIQSFEYGPQKSDFSQDAKALWADSHGLTKFYGRYGTHFISAVKTGASLKIIFTLTASTRAELDGFADAAGLSLGYGGFNLGLNGKVTTATGNYSSSVNITSEVVANGAASFGMPQSVSLDYNVLTQLAKDYITKVGADRTGLAATAFQIRSYRELFGTLGIVSKIAVADATDALGDMTASESDILTFVRWPGFYPSHADVNTAIDVRQRKDALINALDELLQNGSTSNVNKVDSLAISWLTYVPTIDWPTFTNRVLINFDGLAQTVPPNTPAPTSLTPVITIPKVGGYSLQSLTVTTENLVPTGTPPMPSPSSTLTLAQTAAPTPSPDNQGVVYRFEPLDLTTVTGKQIYLEATDSLRHTYRYLIVMRVGGLRTDLAATPQPMVTTH